MSQNGPYPPSPWSSGPGGRPEEPYTEPADPWGDSAVDPPSWVAEHPSAIPSQASPASHPPVGPAEPPSWGQSPPPPRRNTSMLTLVVALGLLICVGLGTTAWLLKERSDARKKAATQQSQDPSASTPDPAGPAPEGSENARFVTKGQCVVNEGTHDVPVMRQSVCTTGTYEVLKRFNGKTSGEKDAEAKCAKVDGYTQWYFYDSVLDDLDFVLCLKERKPV